MPDENAGLPPLPSGAASKPWTPTATAAPTAPPTAPAAPTADAAPQAVPPLPSGRMPQQWRRSMSWSPRGGTHVSMTEVAPPKAPATTQAQVTANMMMRSQLYRALDSYDQVRRHPESWGAGHQDLDALRYSHSLIAKNISALTGGRINPTDPDQVTSLKDSLGMLQAMLMRGYAGSRMGAQLLKILSPHIPQPNDSLEMMGQKMHDLRPMAEEGSKILELESTNPAMAEQLMKQIQAKYPATAVSTAAMGAPTAGNTQQPPAGAQLIPGKHYNGKPAYKLPDGSVWVPD